MTKYPRISVKTHEDMDMRSSFITKRKVGPLISRLRAQNPIFNGIAKVHYSKTECNWFSFQDEDDFRRKLAPCLEKELLNEFGL